MSRSNFPLSHYEIDIYPGNKYNKVYGWREFEKNVLKQCEYERKKKTNVKTPT